MTHKPKMTPGYNFRKESIKTIFSFPILENLKKKAESRNENVEVSLTCFVVRLQLVWGYLDFQTAIVV